MWTTSIALPQTDAITQDSSGFPTHNRTYLHNIPASRKDATRTDEELANQKGYTPTCIYVIDKACYNGAGYLIDEFEEQVYDIKRTYVREKSNMVELTVERREHGKI